jgi:histidine triad (HIT) family protein
MGENDCIFCRIIRGEIPSTKVYEDGACLAFMDIGPIADGHVLLIPRKHAETLDQLSADEAGSMLRNLPNLVAATMEATGAGGANILQNNGKVAHQEVPHVHFHVIPRKVGDRFQFNWPSEEYPQGKAEKLAEAIRSQLVE